MKKISVLIMVFFSLLTFAQESIHFEKSTFKEILAKAKKENKLVFLDAYASWCGPCIMMEKSVFPQDEVKQYFNQNFVNAKIDMEKGEGRDIARKYQVRGYPTFLFLNGDGEVVYQETGGMSASSFVNMAKQANDPNSKKGTVKERFEKGDSDPAFLLNAMKMYSTLDMEFANKVSEKYFATKKDSNVSSDEVNMLFFFTKSVKSPNFKFLVDRKTDIIKNVPENVYQQFVNQLKINQLVEETFLVDKKIIDEKKFITEASNLLPQSDVQTLLSKLKMSFYGSVENWAEYEKSALEYYKNVDSFDTNELLNAAMVFAEKVNNPTSIKHAVVWAEKSVMSNENPVNTYVLSKLYLKSGNKAAAKMFAEQSIHLSKAQNSDASPAEQLLKEILK